MLHPTMTTIELAGANFVVGQVEGHTSFCSNLTYLQAASPRLAEDYNALAPNLPVLLTGKYDAIYLQGAMSLGSLTVFSLPCAGMYFAALCMRREEQRK